MLRYRIVLDYVEDVRYVDNKSEQKLFKKLEEELYVVRNTRNRGR